MGKINKEVLAKLRKKYGEHTINPTIKSSRVLTGLDELDTWMGGGLPRGRVIELYGTESTGKTTFALELAKRVQKAGEFVNWEDFEWSWDDGYSSGIGVDLDPENLMVSRPATLEDGFEMMKTLMLNNPGGLHVLDSLAAGEPAGDSEKEMGGNRIGSHSATVSACLRKLTQALGQSGSILIIINQTRTKMSKGGPGGMTISQTTTGGAALKFYAGMRWKIARKEKKTKRLNGEDVTVWVAELTMTKTKVSKTEGQVKRIWVIPSFGVRVAKPRTTLDDNDE